MTLRLVGVISIVLLLCLATFAFATKVYQEEVMDELAKTVSVVGKAAFRSLEEPSEQSSGRLIVTAHPSEDEDGIVMTRELHVFRDSEEGCAPESIEVEAFGKKISTFGKMEPVPRILKKEFDPGEGESSMQIFYIQTDAIRVEGDPHEELMLHVPVGEGIARVNQEEGYAYDITWVAGEETEKEPEEPARAQVRTEDIVLPIPTGDYGHLFDTFRKKSIVLFCGVFLVGIVLSTGIATRFTRPIRRLDSGIKRLADGDLDVQVLVRGNDEIARLGLAFNEMTRRLRASRDRSRELTRREKLSALGRLAAGVAHDVRNPLHSIGLTLRHLQETSRPQKEGAAEQFDRSIGIIRAEIGRLDRLVENFLGFAGADRGERGPVNLAELMEETARLVSKEAEWRKVEIRLDLQDDVPPLEADVEAVRSSILNLVLNSFEAMPEGGALTLTLQHRDGETVLEVSDTGVGIPEDERELVFDFSYSTREGGSGLGLAMVHQYLVEDHGGRVHLESSEGDGTCIRLVFPAGGKERQ